MGIGGNAPLYPFYSPHSLQYSENCQTQVFGGTSLEPSGNESPCVQRFPFGMCEKIDESVHDCLSLTKIEFLYIVLASERFMPSEIGMPNGRYV
jgi:hypothetical protein